MKINNPQSIKVTNALAEEIRKQFGLKDDLCICYSSFGIFDEFSKTATLRIIAQEQENVFLGDNAILANPIFELDNLTNSYDFIVGDLPLGLANAKWNDVSQNIAICTRKNWIVLFKSLFRLKETGIGLFLIEPSFRSKKWKDFISTLNEYGFFILSIFNPPEKILFPHTSLQPNLVLISREKVDQIFLAQIDDVESLNLQIDNLKARRSSNNLAEGTFVNTSEFMDFDNFKITSQIAKLKSQYKEYSGYKLSDVSNEINLGRTRQQFLTKENSIYIPRVGNSPVISDMENAKLKHQNYIHIVLDNTIVSNKYLELFFSSEMGQLVLKSLYSGSVIPHINISDAKNIVVPIPPLEEQKPIIEMSNELYRLTKKIDDFKRELSLNPRNVDVIKEKAIDLLEQLNLLSEGDMIMSLIRKGESKTLEFKQTLSLDIRKKTKEKYIEKAALKTLVGFLNTDGGMLLIGISDDGEVVGLEDEIVRYNNNLDKFLLYFKNLIKEQVGEEFYPDINYRIVTVNGKYILLIECNAASTPCFLKQKDFYVRTNPATDRLEGPKLIEYINRRFGNLQTVSSSN